MKDLNDLTKWGQAQNGRTSESNHTPLASGPDDDPTLAADVFHHEVPAAARKLGSRAEHLSKKQQHEAAIAALQQALQIDPHYYDAANNLGLEYFIAGKPALAIDTLNGPHKVRPAVRPSVR